MNSTTDEQIQHYRSLYESTQIQLAALAKEHLKCKALLNQHTPTETSVSLSERVKNEDDQGFVEQCLAETSVLAQIKRFEKCYHVVRVGVGVILQCPEFPHQVLIGERKGSHGVGKLALPGGHLELGESWQECAQREVKEETNIDLALNQIEFVAVTNDHMKEEDRHYITIFMKASLSNPSQIQNLEPEKCIGWKWIPWKSLHEPSMHQRLFLPMQHFLLQGLLHPTGV